MSLRKFWFHICVQGTSKLEEFEKESVEQAWAYGSKKALSFISHEAYLKQEYWLTIGETTIDDGWIGNFTILEHIPASVRHWKVPENSL